MVAMRVMFVVRAKLTTIYGPAYELINDFEKGDFLTRVTKPKTCPLHFCSPRMIMTVLPSFCDSISQIY